MSFFKNVVQGVATSVVNTAFKKFSPNFGKTFSSSFNNVTGGLANPIGILNGGPNIGKYKTNMYKFPSDVDGDPGLGNHGHYINFYINQQAGAQMEFGSATGKSGATSILNDAKQRRIPKYISRLAPNRTTFNRTENTSAVTDNQIDIGPTAEDFEESGGAYTSDRKVTLRTAGSGESTGLYMKRNPTVRLDTVITLFMPAQVSVSYKSSYEEATIGAGAAIIGDLYNTIKDNQSIQGLRQGYEDNKEAIKKAVGEGAVKALLASADIIPGMSGLRGAIEAQAGVIISDRMELLFKGLGRRDFSYTFAMIPRSLSEAEAIRNIVFAFKYNMLPEFSDGNRAGRKLRVPNTFDIEYMYLGKSNDYLNKISTCVLKSMDVKYGGDRYKTFDPDPDGNPPPVMTEITLSFEELELITRERVAEGF